MIEFDYRFAKTADTVGTGSESDDWMTDEAVNRFCAGSVHLDLVAQTRATAVLVGPSRPDAVLHPDRGGRGRELRRRPDRPRLLRPRRRLTTSFESVIVNTLTEADLGLAGS